MNEKILRNIIREEVKKAINENKNSQYMLHENIAVPHVINSLKKLIKKGISAASLSKQWHELMRLQYGEDQWDEYWKKVMTTDKKLVATIFDIILNTGFEEDYR